MHKLWIQAAMMFGGVLRGAVGGALGYLNTLLKSGFTTAMQFHQEGIAFARELGMNAKEAQAYTAVLTERTERLAMTYGVAAEQVKELQRNISVATNRQLMLNETQAEQFLQLNKLVGSSTVSQFTEQMMNGMGGSLDAVTGAVSKAYATAAKSGLNAQKVSEKIASNLGMANRLSFRNGVDGLTRMAMQAEKMGMSLQSVESAAGQFLELDKSIENAARMQMLGGSAAVNFGNPLAASYEANYDPEAFAKRLQDSLASYAAFDANKGVASVNGMNMDFVRNIASVMGISAEEATRMAKKQAEVRYKESHISNAYKGMGLSQEQIDFLINKSNVANGKIEFTTSEGQKVDLSSGQAISKAVLDEMMKYEGKSDRDIMEENAKSLTSINEQLIGIKDSIIAMFAKFVQGMFPDIQVDIKNFGQWAKNNLEPTAKNIGVAARGVYDWFTQNKETIKTLASGVLGFIKAFTSILSPVINFAKDWPKTSMAIIAAIWGKRTMNKIGGRGSVGSKASSAARGSSKTTLKNAKTLARGEYKAGRSMGMSRSAAFSEANRNAVNAAGGYGKLAKAGAKMAKGGGIAALGGMVGGMAVDSMVEHGTIEKGSTTHQLASAGTRALEYGGTGAMIGGMLGSFVPVIGNAAGAAVGGAIGGIWGAISGLMDARENAEKGANAANKNNTNIIVNSQQNTALEKHAEGGVVGGNSFNGDKVLAGLNSGEAVITPKQFNTLFSMAESVIKPKPVGGREYIYIPNRSETSNINGNTITVKDFNINLSGTLKLDGGNNSKNVDINSLLNDHQFINSLKEIIKTSINQDMNGGRFLNDLAAMRGQTSSLSIIGR